MTSRGSGHSCCNSRKRRAEQLLAEKLISQEVYDDTKTALDLAKVGLDRAEKDLAITDERARRTRHNTVKSMYEKLRGLAKKNVEEAVPRVGALIQKHTS